MANFTSITGTGSWNDGATWGNSSPGSKGTDWPGNANDNFTISTSSMVIYNVQETSSLGSGSISGILSFHTSSNTLLTFGHHSLTIANGGELRVGSGSVNFITASVSASILWATTVDNSKGIVQSAGGMVTMAGDPGYYGSSDETTLSGSWTTGATFAIYGNYSAKWKSGQHIYIHKNALYAGLADTVVITLNGAPSDAANSVCTTKTVPTFPAGGFRDGGKVINASRNVIIAKADLVTLGHPYDPTVTGSITAVSTTAITFRPLWSVAYKTNIADTDFRAMYRVPTQTTATNNLGYSFTRCVIRNCFEALHQAYGATFSGHIICNSSNGVLAARSTTISGNIFACTLGSCNNYNCAISADIFGCSGDGHASCYANTITGKTFSNSFGIRYVHGSVVTGDVYFNSTGISTCESIKCSGNIYGNTVGVYIVDGVLTGNIGYDSNGIEVVNTTDFRYGTYLNTKTITTVCRGAKTHIPPTNITAGSRNTAGIGSQANQYVAFEYCGPTPGIPDQRKYLPTADVIQTTGSLRPGGASTSIQVIPLSSCATDAPALISEWSEVDVPASSQTRGVYILGYDWSTWPTSPELYFETEYLSDDSPYTKTTITSSQVLTDNTTWTKLSTTFVPAIVSTVRYKLWLGKYEASSEIFVDNMLIRS